MTKRKKKGKTVRLNLQLHLRDRQLLDSLAEVHGTLVASVIHVLDVYDAVVAAKGSVTVRGKGPGPRAALHHLIERDSSSPPNETATNPITKQGHRIGALASNCLGFYGPYRHHIRLLVGMSECAERLIDQKPAK